MIGKLGWNLNLYLKLYLIGISFNNLIVLIISSLLEEKTNNNLALSGVKKSLTKGLF